MRRRNRTGRFALTLAVVLAVCVQTDLVVRRSGTPGGGSAIERGWVMAQPPEKAPLAVVDPCSSYASLSGTYLLLCPQGDGLTEDNYIVVNVCLRDVGGVPVPGVAPEDIWIAGCEGGIAQCAVYTADSTTNSEGRTTITISQSVSEPHWGGCGLGGLSVVVSGDTIRDPTDCSTLLCLPCSTMTPDLDGDLSVGITDFVDFIPSYNRNHGYPTYNPCADFLYDECVDLRDFAMFAAHWEHACGAASAPSASAPRLEWPDDGASARSSGEPATEDPPIPIFKVYFDSQYERDWAECPAAPPGTVLDTLYVVLHNANQWVRAVEYMIEFPPELVWLSDASPEDPLTIGSSPTRIAVAWQTPRNGFEPLLVQMITVLWNCSGCGSSTNVPVNVRPSPDIGLLVYVTSDFQRFNATAPGFQCFGGAMICPDATCDISPAHIDFGTVPVGVVKDTTLVIDSPQHLAFDVDLYETCEDFSTIPSDKSVHFDDLCFFEPESLFVTVRFEPTVDGDLSCVIPTGDCGDITLEGVGVIRTTWYVDLANGSGPWFGTPTDPFRTVADAYAAAADGDSIIIRAGIYSENITMTKQLRIESEGGVVRIGTP